MTLQPELTFLPYKKFFYLIFLKIPFDLDIHGVSDIINWFMIHSLLLFDIFLYASTCWLDYVIVSLCHSHFYLYAQKKYPNEF